jgi:hypothetical protein
MIISCRKENTETAEKQTYLKGMQVTWNERMKKQGSHIVADSPYEAWFTLADVQRMKNAGATCIEMHQIGIPELMPGRDLPNEKFFENWVDVWVDWCTQNEVYCILNVTGLGAWEDWAFYLSLPYWLWDGIYPAPDHTDKQACDAIIRDFFDLNVTKQNINRTAFIHLWKFIANRYKDNPYVIFSIMNEPFWQVEIPDESTAIHLGQSYSTFMEQIVDSIRSTGATQQVIIDLPFLWDHNWRFTVQPVNRENIIWEAHAYGSVWEPGLESFKSNIKTSIQLFVNDFGKPLFVGEYGINPISSIRINNGTNWKAMIEDEVAFLDSLPLAGRQFHCWDDMNGEYSLFSKESDLTPDETNWIIKTVLTNK